MKRAELLEFEKPLVIKECDLPDCPPDGLIVKVSYAGVCHTDVGFWCPPDAWKPLLQPNLPMVMGHEISGYVFQLGENEDPDSDLQVGDRVSVYTLQPCGACALCQNGQEHICKEPFCAVGIHLPGGYASHVAIAKKKYAVKLPDNIPHEIGAVLGCAGLTSYSSICCGIDNIKQMVGYKGHSSLLIIGCGGLGQWAVVSAKAILPSGTKVVVADISEPKLKTAKSLGADEVILWQTDGSEEDVLKTTSDKSPDNGFDCVIDYVANDATLNRAMKLLHKGGVCVVIGIGKGVFKTDMTVSTFVERSLTIKSTLYGTLAQYKDLIKIMADKKPKFPELSMFKFEESFDAFNQLKKGAIPCRAVLKL